MSAPAARRACAPRDNRRGMVLIIVLIIVVMVSLAGFSFVAMMHNEDKATRVRGDELQAEQLVQSGVEMVRTVLAAPAAEGPRADPNAENSAFRGVLVTDDPVSRQRGRFTVLSSWLDETDTMRCRYGLENESAKLNLMTLLRWEQRQTDAGREALLKLPGMTESIADALLDWVDADDEPRGAGAESEFYEALEPPYAPRNGPPECLEELLLVRGVTRQLLFGGDENRNYQLDPEETARTETSLTSDTFAEAAKTVPWSALLTVHGAERNLNPQGRPRVFLNDPNLSRLHGQLRQVLDVELANFIVAYRQFGPADAEASPTVTQTALDLNAPPRFTFVSPLDLIDAKVRMPARNDEKPPVWASPLTERNTSSREKLLRLLDHVTTVPRPVLRGRVNVNLAPAPVLEAIPGSDAGLADRIVAARRGGRAGASAERRHPVWLLFERVVDLQRMKALLPYVTCGGDVHRAQIVGFFDAPGPTCRAEVVCDATEAAPRVLYCKDLRILGRGYSDAMLGVVPLEKIVQATVSVPASSVPPAPSPPQSRRSAPRGMSRGGRLSSDGGVGLD